jgi:hypothetical protein
LGQSKQQARSVFMGMNMFSGEINFIENCSRNSLRTFLFFQPLKMQVAHISISVLEWYALLVYCLNSYVFAFRIPPRERYTIGLRVSVNLEHMLLHWYYYTVDP